MACGCTGSIGGGAGDPIVLLHATGFRQTGISAPIASAPTRIGHVYSYDQRGHGDSSSAPDGEYDWQRTMDDLAAFIIAMEFAARAFGHSAGATAIGSLACERPDLDRARCWPSRWCSNRRLRRNSAGAIP